jgi:manganese transport protein
MRPWLRRLSTRSLAIIPAMITVSISGAQGTYQLLILSQVIISMQLPFAVIPLIRFTSDPARMGALANRGWVKALAWITAGVIVGLNFWLIAGVAGPWIVATPWHALMAIPPMLAITALLLWVTFAAPHSAAPAPKYDPAASAARLPAPVYRRILVPLDHSARDRAAIAHAAAMARLHGAAIYLLHVEEGAISQLFGAEASTAEVHAGEAYFDEIVQTLGAEGIRAELTVAHGRSPKDEIVRAARLIHPDLVVMGAHGHRGVKDLILGNTINGVRHEVAAPVLVVGDLPGN